MNHEKKVQYLRIGLALQNISTNDRVCDQIIRTYEAMLEKGGNFSLHDAVDIELAIEREYKAKQLKEKNAKN